ncbi:DUF945 domain-containing protein [Vibrio tubiashii]|uniref:DUF932 domain-containing protein n=1 Tax=Vibrio tubiashii TaxID=29498 RepID=UPI001EFD512D|nr:DUF932 domain-containing protein [Vibrio tubiashii]MCG9575484.1 DUF945 domain-containing protein [Vibrio tubiashii]
MGALQNSLTRTTASLDFNSIATSQNWRELCLDDRTDTNIFFDVEMQPLKDVTGGAYGDNGEQCVIDVTRNHIIKVHGNQYTLLKNAVAYDMVQESINNLAYAGKLNIEGMHMRTSCVAKGGKAIREYIFPNHTVNVDGSDVHMRIVVINSYDGSANFSLQVGGFRIVCLNGLVTGSKFLNLNQRHSGDIYLGDISNRISTSVQTFNTMGAYWKKLIETPIERKMSDAIWTQFASRDGKPSITQFNMMEQLFENHVRDLGRNYWAAYNTLTAWSTHAQVKSGNERNRADVRLKRETDVSRIITNKRIWDVQLETN